MKNTTERERKCARYLAEEMSPEDRTIFEIELSLDDDLHQLLQSYKDIWFLYNKELLGSDHHTHHPVPHKPVVKKRRRKTNILVGAVSLLIIGFGLLGLLREQLNGTTVVSTAPGERRVFVLPDSSQVTLNAESTLKYPNSFGDTREIDLSGEAYFQVTDDPEHPFIVHTRDMKIRVLGTSFSVNTYTDLKRIALKEGKVDVVLKENQDKITLAPKERLLWDTGTQQVAKEQFEIEKELAWTRNILLLDHVTFKEALVQINRFYGVTFQVDDPVLLNQHITGSFEKERLKDFIASLEFIADIEVLPRSENEYLIQPLHYD